jgi:hypothetical protein
VTYYQGILLEKVFPLHNIAEFCEVVADSTGLVTVPVLIFKALEVGFIGMIGDSDSI